MRRAPENLFEHLKPGTSMAKAREVLGVPTREYANYLTFKFQDAYVQVNTDDGKSIAAVCVVLPMLKRRATFRVYPLNFVLGRSSMSEATWGDEPVYQYDRSSKHYEFRTTQSFGFEGHYLSYIFGVIGAINIKEPNVRWHTDGEGEQGVVISPPKEIIPNMACVISGEADSFSFDFWAFH